MRLFIIVLLILAMNLYALPVSRHQHPHGVAAKTQAPVLKHKGLKKHHLPKPQKPERAPHHVKPHSPKKHQPKRSRPAKTVTYRKPSATKFNSHHTKMLAPKPALESQELPIQKTELNLDDDFTINSTTAQKSLARINQVLQNLHYTHYQYGGSYFNLNRGIYRVDCSHYIDHIVAASNPIAFANLKNFSGSVFPASKDYFQFLDKLPYDSIYGHWYHIKRAQQLQPGDIIVYQYRHHHKSGHVMMVTAKPERVSSTLPIYSLQVSDSASSGHSADTRTRHKSGVGIGTLFVKVDPITGIPAQYAWKAGSRFENNVTIEMGRPIA